MILELGVWVVSTTLIAIGAFLFLFGALTVEPEINTRTVVAAIAAPIGIYLFIRVGRGILRDLRNS